MNRIGLFAKFWQPGRVKTRLGAIGEHLASELYFHFLAHLVAELQHSANKREIVYSPPEREQEFSELAGTHWNLVPQSEGDLGDRMGNYFARAFGTFDALDFPKIAEPVASPNDLMQPTLPIGTATNKVVIIGSDCPLIDDDLIQQAFAILDQQSVVLGPSQDGGYYLIGMNQPFPQIFERIAWSTDRVLSSTLEILQQHRLGYGLLPELADIDEVDDLRSLMRQLKAGQGEAAKRLRARLLQLPQLNQL